MENDIYSSKEYKRSRFAYSAQCAFEYFMALLAGDAYLAKLLTVLELSDELIGIISSFITAAFLFQLTSIILLRRMKSVKRLATVFNTLSSLLFAVMFLIPFAPVSPTVRTVLVTVCILAAYFFNYSVTSIIFKWGNSFVDPKKRGSFGASKEMASLISGMCFTFAVGFVVDRFESLGELTKGFIFIAAAGFVVSLCNLICLLMIAPDRGGEGRSPAISEVIGSILKNKGFMSVILMTCLWEFGKGLTVGFLGIYKTKDLMLTVGTVQIINNVGNLARFFLSKPIGRFSDRHSYVKGLELAFGIAAVGFAFNMFASPTAKWCIVVYTILYAVSNAGTVQNLNNISYYYVETEYFVQATAIRSSVGGVVGFLASLVGSRILGAVRDGGNSIFGLTIYGQQVLSALTLVFVIASILYAKLVVERHEIKLR